MQITFDQLYEHMGPVTVAGNYIDLSESRKVVSHDFGVVLSWPAKYGFLAVEAQSSGSPAGAGVWPGGPQAVADLFQSFGRNDGPPLIDELGNQNQTLLAGRLQRNLPLTLKVTIDTDDEQFLAKAREFAGLGRRGTLPIKVKLINQEHFEETLINLVLSPCTPLPEFNGFVAIDLGNTNSILAALPAGVAQREQHSSIQVLPDVDYDQFSNVTLSPNESPILSMVRVESALNVSNMNATHQTEALWHPNSIGWTIGKWARNNKSPDGVIVGPKRWVARPPGGAKFPVWTQSKTPRRPRIQVPLDNWLPAELFLCRLVQGFQAAMRRRPRKVAITYPTGYSSRELRQLREAMFRALLRSRWERQDTDKMTSSAIDKSIPLAIDEASAAAFFFLYKRIFEPAGGLRRFQYLYPHGFNLLLYDCGGGTTDIALVRAESKVDDRLTITVLGRAALRDFGGDDVTIAVFRILKAKLAHQVYASDGPRNVSQARKLPAWPADPTAQGATLARYLREADESFNQIIPTRFKPGGANLEDQVQQKRALALWEWAERVKEAFAPPGGIKSPTEVKDKYAWDDLTETLCTPPEDRAKREALFELQKLVRVSRVEVDAVVQQQVLNSVTLCNKLIESKLQARTDLHDAEVHLVCLAGNGCRYPLIQEELKKRLKVPFVDRDSDRFLFDGQHLKHAVAKGAVLALASQEAAQLVHVEFDSTLHNKLPFYVGYHDNRTGGAIALFPEGASYSDLGEPKVVELPVRANGESAEGAHQQRYVQLDRRWPGEEKHWLPFLTFYFQRPIQGPVEIWYDQQKHDFVVRHNNEMGQRPHDDRDDQYLAPVQRGQL